MMIIRVGFLLFLLIPSVISQLLESPCPGLFEYTANHEEIGEYIGTVALFSNIDLLGVWVQLTFNKAFVKLVNTFGDVITINGTETFIEKPHYKLRANTNYKFSFILKYDPDEPPPRIQSFKLNGHLICGQFPSLENRIIDNDCGIRTVSVASKTHTAQDIEEGEFPWYAALYHTNGTYFCGATLISKNHVITVARCVTRKDSEAALNPQSVTVSLGKQYKETVSIGVQDRQASKIIRHPEYNAQSYSNDIALIKFTIPVDITDYVRPVCLWQDSFINSSFMPTEKGILVGWGEASETLVQAAMQVYEPSMCGISNPNPSDLFAWGNTYCAGYVRDTPKCVDDSGSGMVFLANGSNSNDPVWQLRGLVSISVALQSELKCHALYLIMLTDTVRYLEWIEKAMIM